MLTISPYNPDWPKMAADEMDRIRALYGNEACEIHHMGSTSVPGLDAKPIIDMIVVVESIHDFDFSKLESLGYTNRGELIIPLRTVLHRGDPRDHFVHVFEKGDPQIKRNLCFRNYLISHPEKRDAYGDLKHKLAQEFEGSKTFWGYTRFKAKFIEACLKEANFDAYIFNRAYAPEEWEEFKNLMLESGVAEDDLTELSQQSLLKYDRNYFILTQFGHVVCGAIVTKNGAYKVESIAYDKNAPAFAKTYFQDKINRWTSDL